MSTTLDEKLLALLACPQDKGPLLLVDDELLYNPRLRRVYPIDDGIPVLLIDEARDATEAEHQDYTSRSR